jgi:hypothetical protein
MFDEDDGSYPEICICGLTAAEVAAGYQLIRKCARILVGRPAFYDIGEGREVGLDEVACAASLVCEKKANPFHFLVRNLEFRKGELHETGVFILDNAIAFDYPKSRLWGEMQIETLLLLINKIKEGSDRAFIRLEDAVSPDDRQRLQAALDRLANPHPDD